jgi:hypothetical protein
LPVKLAKIKVKTGRQEMEIIKQSKTILNLNKYSIVNLFIDSYKLFLTALNNFKNIFGILDFCINPSYKNVYLAQIKHLAPIVMEPGSSTTAILLYKSKNFGGKLTFS